MAITYFYLHGFASGPRSAKGVDLQHRLAALDIELLIPDLNQSDFSNLTLTRQIQYVATLLPRTSVVLIGSSLGGLIAAWVAEDHPQVEQLILLAPAFQFLDHWLPRLGNEAIARWEKEGSLSIHHYGEQKALPLNYTFVRDARLYPETHLARSLPTLIIHGIQDEVVPIEASRRYAATRPWVTLLELEADHSLKGVTEEIWQAVQQRCSL